MSERILKHCLGNLDGEDPTGTRVSFDGNFSQREYQIHFQPLADAAYQTVFYSEALSCPARLLDVSYCWSDSYVSLNQFPHLAVELLFA